MKNNRTKIPLLPILELFSTHIDFLLALLIIRTPEFKSLCGILCDAITLWPLKKTCAGRAQNLRGGKCTTLLFCFLNRFHKLLFWLVVKGKVYPWELSRKKLFCMILNSNSSWINNLFFSLQSLCNSRNVTFNVNEGLHARKQKVHISWTQPD